MKKVIGIVALVLSVTFSTSAQHKMKKNTKTIALEQTPGEFAKKELTVEPGTYVFEISNNNVGHDVGFVLVKKGNDVAKPENHIPTAYVTEVVATGKTQSSKPTQLEKENMYISVR